MTQPITLEALTSRWRAIDVIGPLSYYDYDYDGTNPNYVYDKSKYQVMLADQQDITKINGD